ncbi:MFS transporter [Flammeovirga yaeyamensis]|uniref:MFS transporter n=1 Tax=Flammeovirga yaeyamensis TaxID=367791 RepID=A0AAX1N5P3_9BACT|nr:MFS transporter [Flammeovirga yaeyamensis]MBB3697452.1 MFS family permease [Flammeovirga yaeyamensis]NMF36146.1 SLC45 family MFS transporter [Flammeovirga yaeyamensis]QWG02879.1 MFS transporter [Flammeovirga yaeyamensis]
MLEIQKKLKSSFYTILSLPATAMGFALSIQISALSWILSEKYGFHLEEIGIVWAAGPLAGIIAQPIAGLLSDNVWLWGGRRRPFILIGGVLTSIMLLAIPNMDIIGKALGQEGATVGIAIAIALTFDLAINVSFNPTRSIIADVTPEGEKRTSGYTWMQTISGTFGVLAYAIGAFFDNYVLIYSGIFIVFAFSVFPLFFIEEPKQLTSTSEGEEQSKVSFSEIMDVIKPLYGFLIYAFYVIVAKVLDLPTSNIYIEIGCLVITLIAGIQVILVSRNVEKDKLEFQKILFAHSFTWIGVQSMFVYMLAFAKVNVMGFEMDQEVAEVLKNNIGKIVAISFLVLNLVGAIFPSLIINPLVKKIGQVKTHTISLAIMTLGYFGVYSLVGKDSEYLLYFFMVVIGVGWASIISISFAIMSERVDKSKMGLYMGIFNLSVVAPQLVSSFKIGQLVNSYDDKAILFLICTITLLVSTVLWLTVREKKGIDNTPSASTGGGHH